MTDNSAEPTPVPDEPALAVPQGKVKPAASAAKWIILLIMFALAGIATSAWLLNKIRRLEMTLNTASATWRTSSETVSARIAAISNTITDMQAQQDAMGASITDLYEQRPASNEDWALAEVEYLLTLSLHQLQLADDLQSALLTMEAAASRLEGITDKTLDPVRQQLAADIGQLAALNNEDITGISIYLADLIDRAESLPLRKDVIEKDENTGVLVESVPEESGFGLRSILSELWNSIEGLVVIKRGVEGRKVLLPPQQEYFLYQNLRLELENARLSVIRKDTENLRTSINLIKNWLQEYYDIGDKSVINIVETLDMMAGVELQPELPDITSSLETLRAWQHGHAAPDQISLPP